MKAKTFRTFTCQQCGGEMHQTTKREHSGTEFVLGVILLLIGIVLCSTCLGAILGVPLIIISLFMGAKTRKVWKCGQCGYFVERY